MQQQYVYHYVPVGMNGHILYPLNILKKKLPEVYANQAAKYDGREGIMKRVIPLLNCLWNDVLHLSAVNPDELIGHIRASGIYVKKIELFKIPVETLDTKNICVMFAKKVSENYTDKCYETFEEKNFSEYSKFNDDVLDYFKSLKGDKTKLQANNYQTHILYKGMIDTTGLEIIEV